MGSDSLLVVMPFYAKWIPTKIYDYLRIGKPILALVPPDRDAAKIIQEAKGGYPLSRPRKDEAAIRVYLRTMETRKVQGFSSRLGLCGPI